MSDTLTKKEIKKLIKLGKSIMLCLDCDINETGLPCRTDRLSTLALMVKYLEIHNYSVVEGSNVFQSIVTHINGKKINK